jgi:hypothetical protein
MPILACWGWDWEGGREAGVVVVDCLEGKGSGLLGVRAEG